MNTTAPNSPKQRWGVAVRWIIAAAIVWFLGSRIANDWPTVQSSFSRLRWAWLAAGLLPAIVYFLMRVAAWRNLLKHLNVPSRFGTAAMVWANGEVVRYIPGNIWSVVGRLAQSTKMNTNRTTMFMSMVLETIVLMLAATGISAIVLIGYPDFKFPMRTVILVVIAGLTLFFASPRPLRWLLHLLQRLLRRTDDAPVIGHAFTAFGYMAIAWLMYALFQLTVAVGLGVTLNFSMLVTMIGAFTLSWIIGYVSFLTPSGLGVREVALVWLLRPYVDQSTALLIAVLSRVMMIAVEVAIVGAVNMLFRRRIA